MQLPENFFVLTSDTEFKDPHTGEATVKPVVQIDAERKAVRCFRSEQEARRQANANQGVASRSAVSLVSNLANACHVNGLWFPESQVEIPTDECMSQCVKFGLPPHHRMSEETLLECLRHRLASLTCKPRSIEVSYSGSGDSGDFMPMMAIDATGGEVQLGRADVDTISTVLELLLESRYGGWEINEGSHGYFLLNVQARKLTHQHTMYVEAYEKQEDIL